MIGVAGGTLIGDVFFSDNQESADVSRPKDWHLFVFCASLIIVFSCSNLNSYSSSEDYIMSRKNLNFVHFVKKWM